MICGTEATLLIARQRDFLHGLLLHGQAGLQVTVSGCRTLVPEEQSDHFQRDAPFEQIHGGRVSKGMRRDAALFQRGDLGGGSLNQLVELKGGTSPAQSLSEAVGQQRGVGSKPVFLEPTAHSALSLAPYWQHTMFASLAQQLHLLAAGGDILHPQAKDFRDSGARRGARTGGDRGVQSRCLAWRSEWLPVPAD